MKQKKAIDTACTQLRRPEPQITYESWDFIEKYLPDYSDREDVLRQGCLQFFIDGHDTTVMGEVMSRDEAEDELHLLLYNIHIEAIDAYTKGRGVECEHCKSQCGGYCRHCGKLLPQSQRSTGPIPGIEKQRAKYINEIKAVINQYGGFSTASVMADSSPITKDDACTTQLAEVFSAGTVTLITYSNETEQEIDEEDVPYDELSMGVLAEIHSLAISWKEENESLQS